MRRTGLIIIWLLCVVPLFALNDTIDIPLTMSVFRSMPKDDPTTSTPDPTDPNQFRVLLVGHRLLIETQAGLASYVVIRERESSQQNEDYFYDLSFGSIECPIMHTGVYAIHIGCWKTDFIGFLDVRSLGLYDFNGHLVSKQLDPSKTLPSGLYIIQLKTTAGTTSSKFYRRP